MTDRVLITGLGPVTGFGVGIEPLWQAMNEPRHALRRISRFDPSGFVCRHAAEMDADAFNIRQVVPKSYRKATKVMCRDIELAVAGADNAVSDAGLVTKASDPEAEPTVPPHRIGCHIGAGLIAADVDELTAALVTSRNGNGDVDLADWGEAGMQNLTPLWLLKYLPNMLACHVTIIHDLQGPSNTITCSEASSALSLGESVRVISRGGADVCLTGGAEFKINPMAMFRQQCIGRLAKTGDDDDPGAVLRPFDPKASGTLIGEGGGILIVESARLAERRGAEPYAEVAGFASTMSLCRNTLSFDYEPDDPALGDCIDLALGQAGLGPDDVDAIVPLGSSIANVDQAEAEAIRRVFGSRAGEIPIVATVPFTGNCGAGNGAVGLSVACMCLKTQTLPARLNTTGAEGLDANTCKPHAADLRTVLVLTASQGGQNAAIILRQV